MVYLFDALSTYKVLLSYKPYGNYKGTGGEISVLHFNKIT